MYFSKNIFTAKCIANCTGAHINTVNINTCDNDRSHTKSNKPKNERQYCNFQKKQSENT